MKKTVKKIAITFALIAVNFIGINSLQLSAFPGSKRYWINRYQSGGHSGGGSYGKLAEFKADILNTFVHTHNIKSIIEFGSGDGNQLRLANYPDYLGFDVSPEAIQICEKIFAGDTTKTFQLMNKYNGQQADLALSIDVLFHLIEDDIFQDYMTTLFKAANKFVIIYSSNTDKQELAIAPHVKHRKFTQWITKNAPEWKLIQHIPNQYPFSKTNKKGSFSEFFVYQREL